MVFEQTWQCRVSAGSTSTVTNCGSQRFCLDGNCFDTGYPPDADFARVVAGLEVQREAGKYLDPATLVVFQGHDNRCRKKLFGLVNCCKGAGSDTSLFSTLNLVLGAGGQALGAIGSSYTYDALFVSDAPNLVIAGFEALFGVGGGSSALAGLIAGDLSVASFVGSLVPGPWTLAILAIQLSGILDCEEAEQILALKRDNRLCHGVGSYCSARIPVIGTCIETTESYCCFNSQARPHPQRAGPRPTGQGLGRGREPGLQRLHAGPVAGAGLLADEPRRVLCRDRAHPARPRDDAGPGAAEGGELLRAMISNRNLHAMLLATLMLVAAHGHATERVPVTDLKPLLLRAIDRGSAKGVLAGEAASFMQQKFASRAPIEIDVVSLHPLPQAGCHRLEVTTRQRDVVEEGRREDKTLSYRLSFCRNGRFPEKR